ncbi:unnamed protein product [Didymodactylos carnosus]|uniref:Uncharacterized protein n=1 Tax=Didymodactylos carnosus TaxID=1234261 RepID=A0A814I785_9BILA|nr:unnamed protein product [Didymodactylos carnosus]CAF1404375.1 unnamed protein product [Didymodactylos carnosus]CAF3791131.1 unnamed protein product [Didymodactylos carnosus]CAF4210520.1 unnamed protein product [Didymodactylos carnosus]
MDEQRKSDERPVFVTHQFFVAQQQQSPAKDQQDGPPESQERTPSQMNQSTSTSDLEITAVVNASLNPADIPERTSSPSVTQPATQTFGIMASYPLFTHATVPEVTSPPSSRQSQYKQQGSRRLAVLRRIRQTTGSLEEIPTFSAAKPRTGTSHPASPPPSHPHFAPIVASSPMVSKLLVPVMPRVVTSKSPSRFTTQSTITLASATVLPPRTTSNASPAVSTSIAPLVPQPLVPVQRQQSQATMEQVHKPPVWIMPGKSWKSSSSNRQHEPYYATPLTADAEQQNYMALLPPPRYTTGTAKSKKPYAQLKNAQQQAAPPPIDLVDESRPQGYRAQRYQQRDTATAMTNKPNHVILSDSTMSRFRLSQFNNNTVNVRIKSNSGFGIRNYINQITSGQLRYLLAQAAKIFQPNLFRLHM